MNLSTSGGVGCGSEWRGAANSSGFDRIPVRVGSRHRLFSELARGTHTIYFTRGCPYRNKSMNTHTLLQYRQMMSVIDCLFTIRGTAKNAEAATCIMTHIKTICEERTLLSFWRPVSLQRRYQTRPSFHSREHRTVALQLYSCMWRRLVIPKYWFTITITLTIAINIGRQQRQHRTHHSPIKETPAC